ncbi:copper amine oxidase [Colletotrichum incanum]|uniref:Amine oxidase n=1 Tax=Colletotrichum incanum TaxID=1573173 RepID=A0A161XY70_COLIC|nr:copper amine oxidase [Colletotrichum incanum]
MAATRIQVLHFRVIYLREPSKDTLVKFLELEHAGQLTPETPRPPRLASVHYIVVEDKESPRSIEAVVDLKKRERVWHKAIKPDVHPSFTLHELEETVRICKESTLLQFKISALSLPDGFEAVIEPWPYGGLDSKDKNRCYFQALVFAVDTRTENPDANFYSYPLPLIPVVDWVKQEVVRIDELATGGGSDSYQPQLPKEGIIDHCRPSDVLYRLSISDMTVPYADPRNPIHSKQAFDFGDGGIGHCANNLELGCDCLGVIKYFDGVLNRPDGSAHVSRNVICLHEQDNGIGWKHTNWRTNRAVVTRRRELVIQFILTVAKYEYVFNVGATQLHATVAGGITVETRATGILSAVNIDIGKAAPWGNIVSPGVLAQNHQHIFCVRIDPAIDGHQNTLVQQESLPLQIDARTNPNGNAYQVQETPITTSIGLNAAPQNARLFKIQNFSKRNPTSQRAFFAQHHLWVTKYKDDELYAGGRYTLQSTIEEEGVSDAAARCDDVVQTDIVLWSVFGLTHNPRVEDWPVMPVETIQLHITPVDFFTENPAIDVPSNRNLTSQYVQERVEGKANGVDLRVTCCN